MKRYLLILIGLFFIAAANGQTDRAKVYVFVAEDCPVSIYMTTTLKSISTQYVATADFYLVFPLPNSTAKTSTAFKEQYSLSDYTCIVDKKQNLSKKLGAAITPEVIVTNHADSILYKGRINDAYLETGKRRHIFSSNDLADALALVADNKTVPQPWRPAIGCYITYKK